MNVVLLDLETYELKCVLCVYVIFPSPLPHVEWWNKDILGAFNTLNQKGEDQKALAFTSSEIP